MIVKLQKDAVLFITHGSRSPKTKQEINRSVKLLKRRSKTEILEFAFLEIENPNIPEGIATCVKKGATVVTVLLNFLNSGRHVDRDIPQIIKDAKKQYPRVLFRVTRPVGQHKKIPDLFLDMLRKKV